jgi:YcxB-like protein
MQVHFSLTEDDYREFQQAYFARLAGFWDRNHVKIFVTFGALVIVAGLNWIYYLHRGRFYGFTCVVLGLALIWLGAWGRFWKWRRWFSKNRRWFQDIEGEISAEGLMLRTKTEETRTKWEHYSGFVETENLILLQTPLSPYVIVPKRALAPSELVSFQELLRNKLTEVGR